jgi:hypothetical protein
MTTGRINQVSSSARRPGHSRLGSVIRPSLGRLRHARFATFVTRHVGLDCFDSDSLDRRPDQFIRSSSVLHSHRLAALTRITLASEHATKNSCGHEPRYQINTRRFIHVAGQVKPSRFHHFTTLHPKATRLSHNRCCFARTASRTRLSRARPRLTMSISRLAFDVLTCAKRLALARSLADTSLDERSSLTRTRERAVECKSLVTISVSAQRDAYSHICLRIGRPSNDFLKVS